MVTRFHPLLLGLLALLLFGASEAYAQTATVVTHSGQRLRGQIMSMGGNSGYGNNGNNGNYGNGNYDNSSDSIVVRTNGRDRQIPVQDVALVDFAGNGNVSQNEMNQANNSYDGMVVLRNGRTMLGHVVELQGYNNQAVVSGQGGDRTVPLNQVARIYFGNGTTASNGYDPYSNPNQNVYGNNYPQNDPYGQNGQPSYGTARTVTIPANQTWSNSGIDVRRGEVIHFRASGNVTLSQNPRDYGTPAGANDGRMAGNSPLRGVTGGMLIGRVGNSQPFVIGAEADVTMPANGRLFLGVNDDDVRDKTGSFVVQMLPR
jgi:hypothetical protein